MGGGGGTRSDIRPLKIKYQTPQKNKISDITPPKKSNIRYLTPQKNQISDI